MVGGLDRQKKLEIAERVRLSRKRCGLSQKEVSVKVGCSQQTIGNVETGASYHHGILRDISAALGVAEHWLLTGTDPEPESLALNEIQNEFGRASASATQMLKALVKTIPDDDLRQKMKLMIDEGLFDVADFLLEELKRRASLKKMY